MSFIIPVTTSRLNIVEHKVHDFIQHQRVHEQVIATAMSDIATNTQNIATNTQNKQSNADALATYLNISDVNQITSGFAL